MAINFLVRHGYKIIEINAKTSYKEIDIVAHKDDEIIFVEVKTRTSSVFGFAEDSVSSQKFTTLRSAIDIYLRDFNKIKYNDIRLDLVAINMDMKKRIAEVKHYKNIA